MLRLRAARDRGEAEGLRGLVDGAAPRLERAELGVDVRVRRPRGGDARIKTGTRLKCRQCSTSVLSVPVTAML